jgi:hypothetical protein
LIQQAVIRELKGNMERSVFSGIQFIVWAMQTFCGSGQEQYWVMILINIYRFCVIFMASVRELNFHTVYLYKQPLLLGNRLLTHTNGLTEKRLSLHSPHDSRVTQQQKSCWERCFLCSPCQSVISRTSLEFSKVWDSCWLVRTWTQKFRDLLHWKPLLMTG